MAMDGARNGLVCVDIRSMDGASKPPRVVEEAADELFKHFMSATDGQDAHTRLLTLKIPDRSQVRETVQSIEDLFPAEVIDHAIWKPDVYHKLTKNEGGGAAGLIDEPVRFVLQTPLDGGPFCSFALSKRQSLVKGLYLYDNPDFDPAVLKGGESTYSGWRSSGLQIVTLAEMFLLAHSAYVSQLLPAVIAKVHAVESTLVASRDDNLPDFNALGRTLHTCHSDLVQLERRSRFEQTGITAVETVTRSSSSNRSTSPDWPPLAPIKAAIASRTFDFESLPRRIDNCRATMNSLMQRHNEQLNLELTRSSYMIAEATARDSKSMKTIAIMTMILLPATAVASLFSMSMFDWSAERGDQIASKWLWIYFIVAIPMTALILAIWWMWVRKTERGEAAPMKRGEVEMERLAFKDEEGAME